MEEIQISTLAGGAVEERFNDALQEVLENIQDPNTDAKKKRKITLTVTFEPKESRDFTGVDFQVKTTLQPAVPVQTGLIIGIDGKGHAVAAEYSRQIPGQTFVDESTGEIKVVAMSR